MTSISIECILDLLTKRYGNHDWQPDNQPLSMLIQTILSQNTSDTNSRRAFRSLLIVFSSWEDIADAEVSDIADSIRKGGLADIKAERIKRTLIEIRQNRGRLELDFLNKLPLEEARDWLKQLPGVGTKTANCVLLFSLGKPALPVDTHVFRIVKRLGLVNSKTSVEHAHNLLEGLVPINRVYQFHILMIEHGRKVCQAQRPLCIECVIQDLCPSYGLFAR